jgi:hypothetical protein
MGYIIVLLVLSLLVFLLVSFTRRKTNMSRALDMVFLKVLIPRKESDKDKQDSTSGMASEGFKEALGVMEQFYANMHGIGSGSLRSLLFGNEYISFEYAFLGEEVFLYVVVPRKLMVLVEKQITSFYPEAVVEQTPDYNLFLSDSKQATTYLHLTKHVGYPIRTYKSMETDPFNSIVNSMSKLGKEETAAIQIMLRPVKGSWQKKCKRIASALQSGKKEISFNPLTWIGDILDMFMGGSQENKPDANKPTPLTEEAMKALGEKAHSVGYDTIIRIISSAPTKDIAAGNLYNIKKSFAQFAFPDMASFSDTKNHSNRACLKNFIYRYFTRSIFAKTKGKMILSTAELASLFHFPNTKFNRIAAIKWQNFKIAPPPQNLPKEGIFLGWNLYRGIKTPVYIKNEDRFRHFYVIGQTGTGKSTILTVMVVQDLKNNVGFAVMDPHGQLADDVFSYIPRERADDIIYFNPADTERPMGLNMLEGNTDEEKELVAMDAMNIMIKLFGNEIFGPRIQDYFRNGCLTLMADPEGGALTDIVRLFTDDVFQQYKVTKVKNPIVRSFWEKQMAATGQREKQEMIPYFAAKFGQFTTNALMRNIIGQVKSSFDVAEIMNTGKILLVNLSKGLIGDINSNLLGLILVSKIQVAAMRRQRQSATERKDFFLYIDEFQNYVSDSIESILSEARKYRLGLNIAHQYIGQLEKKQGIDQGTVNLKDAIFGNIGTIVSFKIGAVDAEYMEKEMTPVFTQQDLVNIDARKAVIKLAINGQPSRPFSLNTVHPSEVNTHKEDPSVKEAFIQLSRLKYGRDKDFVSREIIHRIGAL